jgi:thiamine pyrophosphate-dependent acetolactate synthase large subunit-like protein
LACVWPTPGPGATNLVTGIADARSDSTAIVAITGNVPSHLLGKNAFQEVDIVAVTKPITKRNYLVGRVAHIPEVVREAFAMAAGNRPGPVLVDIPKDIQQHYPRDPEGNIIHIDIDRNELNKNKTVTLPICANLDTALGQLADAVEARPSGEWNRYLNELRSCYPYTFAQSDAIKPQYAIQLLSTVTAGEAIISLGVGQHQM